MTDLKTVQAGAAKALARGEKLRASLHSDNRRLVDRAGKVHDRMNEEARRLRKRLEGNLTDEQREDAERAYQAACQKRGAAMQARTAAQEVGRGLES